jgi:hypothetical protein
VIFSEWGKNIKSFKKGSSSFRKNKKRRSKINPGGASENH